MEIAKQVVDALAYTLDTLKITRRIGFYFTLWVTYYAITQCIDLAKHSDMDGTGLGLVIGAIMVPISGLQAGALHFHHQGHKDAKKGDQ